MVGLLSVLGEGQYYYFFFFGDTTTSINEILGTVHTVYITRSGKG